MNKKCQDCGTAEATHTFYQDALCEDCYDISVEDAEHERATEMWYDDPHGYRDPTPEEEAGWAFEDKLAMYRNEY